MTVWIEESVMLVPIDAQVYYSVAIQKGSLIRAVYYDQIIRIYSLKQKEEDLEFLMFASPESAQSWWKEHIGTAIHLVEENRFKYIKRRYAD
jgi:hypothetical protein